MPRRLGPTFIACPTYQSFLSFSFEEPSLAARSLVKTCSPRLNIRLSATYFDFDHVIWRHFSCCCLENLEQCTGAAIFLMFALARFGQSLTGCMQWQASSLRVRHKSILTLSCSHALRYSINLMNRAKQPPMKRFPALASHAPYIGTLLNMQ